MLKFRNLKADEIECRVATVKKNGLSLLLYKDARVDQNILDETVGPMNWQRHHSRDNANCVISIWDDEKKQWIEKEDTGTESYTEKEKGLASDSFKRAAFNWGIGRELYTAPFIWVNANDCDIKPKGSGYTCYDRFEVKEITIEDGKITGLVVIHEKTRRVIFKMGATKPQEADTEVAPNQQDIVIGEGHIRALRSLLARKGLSERGLQKRAGKTFDKWTMADFREFMDKLNAVPDKQQDNVDLGL